MSDIEFECPHCKKSLKVETNAVGMQMDCPDCGAGIKIPTEPLSELDITNAIEEPELQEEETLQPDTTPEKNVAHNSEASLRDDFRKLLEKTSRSIIPKLEEASAEIRKELEKFSKGIEKTENR